jgi:hypothetical protein
MIERFFNNWYVTWAFTTDSSSSSHGRRHSTTSHPTSSKSHPPHPSPSIPPYVEILAQHTRLNVFSSIINHPTATPSVKQFFHAAGLSSSLNVMRAAVQGEGRLKSMPNNTAIMVSYAACFALRLSRLVESRGGALGGGGAGPGGRGNGNGGGHGNGVGPGGGSGGGNGNGNGNGSGAPGGPGQIPITGVLVPSIKVLVEETADVLERIGSVPAHRKGASAMYGRQLREVVRNLSSASANASGGASGVAGTPRLGPQTHHQMAAPGHPSHGPHNVHHLSSAGLMAASGHHAPHPSGSGYINPPQGPSASSMLSFEPLLFSAMSDEQIVEAISGAGQSFNFEGWPDLGAGGGTGWGCWWKLGAG